MRVAFVSTFPPVHCGIGEYTHFLVQRMARHESPLYVFSSFGSARRKGKIHSIPSFEPRSEDFRGLLRAIGEKGPFDVVHIQHEYGIFGKGDGFLEFLEGLRPHAGVICLTLHTVIHSLDRKLCRYQHTMIDLVDGVFVHSTLGEYELWMQEVDLRKVFLVPHGTHINRFRPNRRALTEIVGSGFSADGSFLITVPGFLRWDKGITTLQVVSERIMEEFPDTAIIVAGGFQAEGKELRQLKAAVAEVDAGFGQVWFTRGFLRRKDLFRLLASSDAILLPYREWPGHMGVSGILHLAMGTCKPIIASRVPRLVEYTQMFPELAFVEEDVDGLIKALRYLRENYSEILLEVRKRLLPFLRRTSWEATARRHLEIYRALLTSSASARERVPAGTPPL